MMYWYLICDKTKAKQKRWGKPGIRRLLKAGQIFCIMDLSLHLIEEPWECVSQYILSLRQFGKCVRNAD